MTLSTLIKSNSWLSIQLVLLQLHPDEQEFIEEYEKVFNELRIMQPLTCNITIEVSMVDDDYDNTQYVNVSGYYTNPSERSNEYTNSLAIEFVPWIEWLGMEIDKNSFENYTELEIIAHCLHEMTYAGFEHDEIQAQIDKINQMKVDYESLTPEEKTTRTFTYDELLERFNEDINEDEENIENENRLN
jgi:hypothetical protein